MRHPEHARSAWCRLLLIAITAVWAAMLLGTTASASAAGVAHNRVGAISFVGEVLVQSPQSESPGHRFGNDVAGPGFVVATGVAANDGAGAARTLFRADTRGPDEIFNSGFSPKGSNLDLVEHVTQNPADSGFVSTTHSLSSAQDFADEVGAKYIYKLRGIGRDVNAELGASSPFPWENEIAVPGHVPGSAIEGVWGPGGWLDNPAFVR